MEDVYKKQNKLVLVTPVFLRGLKCENAHFRQLYRSCLFDGRLGIHFWNRAGLYDWLSSLSFLALAQAWRQTWYHGFYRKRCNFFDVHDGLGTDPRFFISHYHENTSKAVSTAELVNQLWLAAISHYPSIIMDISFHRRAFSSCPALVLWCSKNWLCSYFTEML